MSTTAWANWPGGTIQLAVAFLIAMRMSLHAASVPVAAAGARGVGDRPGPSRVHAGGQVAGSTDGRAGLVVPQAGEVAQRVGRGRGAQESRVGGPLGVERPDAGGQRPAAEQGDAGVVGL